MGPITPQKIAAMPVNERAQETGIPTVPTDFFLALLRRLFFYGRKAVFFSVLPLYPVWLSVPKGSLTKYLTAAADSAAERTVSEVLYIRSHIFDTRVDWTLSSSAQN